LQAHWPVTCPAQKNESQKKRSHKKQAQEALRLLFLWLLLGGLRTY
jgi:hypothetical protein